jgi:hypothetical protein
MTSEHTYPYGANRKFAARRDHRSSNQGPIAITIRLRMLIWYASFVFLVNPFLDFADLVYILVVHTLRRTTIVRPERFPA